MRRWKKHIGLGICGFLALILCYVLVGWFVFPTWVVIPGRQIAYWYSGISSKSVDVKGHEWPYLECGDRSRTSVIMLHGFATSKDAMMLMMGPVAAKGYHVIAPDLPGFGDHEFHTGEHHNAAFYAAGIKDFMDAVGVNRAVLVGNSMGGALAAEVAIQNPKSALALVMLSPAGMPAAKRNSFMQAVDRGENPFDIRTGKDLDRIVKTVFWVPPYIPTPVRSWLVQRAVERRDGTLEIVEALRPFLENGLQGRMRQIHVPTLVLYGERDAVTDPSMLLEFGKEQPDATLAVVRDAGHVSYYDNWDGVWTEFERVLDRVGSGY